MKITVLDGYAGNPDGLSWEPLRSLGELTVYDRTSTAELVEHAKDADIVLTNKVCLGAAEMDRLPNLKYIGVIATGYNIIDCDAARERNIVVTNIPAYSTDSVAQMTFAHILAICDRVEHYTEEVREGKWTRCKDFTFMDTPVVELHGKKIGIIGLGNTGSATARIAIGFGMEVYAYTSKSDLQLVHEIKKASLEEIFSNCDIVSLHCPLNDSTRGIVNAERLSTMKPTAIIINTARGALVNAQDLADALNSGRIMAAGMDVLEQEPPRADNPLLTARNCFITPHIAWASREARMRLMQILTDNVRAYVEGAPVNVVNK